MISGNSDYQKLRDLAAELGYGRVFVKAVDTLFAARADEIRAETRAKTRAETRAETLLQQVAARWGNQGEPSKQTEETIRAGADREFRAWTAAIVTEDSLEAFLAAPDKPR